MHHGTVLGDANKKPVYQNSPVMRSGATGETRGGGGGGLVPHFPPRSIFQFVQIRGEKLVRGAGYMLIWFIIYLN